MDDPPIENKGLQIGSFPRYIFGFREIVGIVYLSLSPRTPPPVEVS